MSVASTLDVLGVLVRQLQGALGGKTIRAGADQVTFPAVANAKSLTTTVDHGLAQTPTAVTLTGYNDLVFELVAKSSTQFQVLAWFPAGTIANTSYPFDWIAVG